MLAALMRSLMFRLLSQPLRLPAFLGPAARPDDPQIFRFNGERAGIIGDVVRRVVKHYAGQPDRLLYVLNEAGNAEVRRLASQGDLEASDALGDWRRLIKRLGKMGEEERRGALRDIVGRMAGDIAGNFDVRVYGLATKIIPGVLTAIMSPGDVPRQLLSGFRSLDERILEMLDRPELGSEMCFDDFCALVHPADRQRQDAMLRAVVR